MNTESYALRCEESAIKFEADAKESENKINEFRIKKVNYRKRKRKLKEDCPNGKIIWQKRKKIRQGKKRR